MSSRGRGGGRGRGRGRKFQQNYELKPTGVGVFRLVPAPPPAAASSAPNGNSSKGQKHHVATDAHDWKHDVTDPDGLDAAPSSWNGVAEEESDDDLHENVNAALLSQAKHVDPLVQEKVTTLRQLHQRCAALLRTLNGPSEQYDRYLDFKKWLHGIWLDEKEERESKRVIKRGDLDDKGQLKAEKLKETVPFDYEDPAFWADDFWYSWDDFMIVDPNTGARRPRTPAEREKRQRVHTERQRRKRLEFSDCRRRARRLKNQLAAIHKSKLESQEAADFDESVNVPEDMVEWMASITTRSMLTKELREQREKKRKAAIKARVLKRLAKDFRNCLRNPLVGVVAAPVYDNDWFEWHCNVRGISGTPYAAISLHMVIRFPEHYPLSPPDVYLKTSIPHPHVYREWVCLDMLSPTFSTHWNDQGKKESWGSWSTAYDVQAILLNIQSFLMHECDQRIPTKPKDWYIKNKKEYEYHRIKSHNARINNAVAFARKFKCDCGHHGKDPYPAYRDREARARLIQMGRSVPNLRRKKKKQEKKQEQKQASPVPSSSSSSSSATVSGAASAGAPPAALFAAAATSSSSSSSKASDPPMSASAPALVPSKITDLSQIKIDDVVVGTVKSIQLFGAFVDIGWKRDALMHVSQLRDAYTLDPADAVSVGDVVRAMVTRITGDRVSLSIRRLQQREGTGPRALAAKRRKERQQRQRQSKDRRPRGRGKPLENLVVGSTVRGRIKSCLPHAAFVDIKCVTDGYLPLSEIKKAVDQHVWEVKDVYTINDVVDVVVTKVDVANRKVSLSLAVNKAKSGKPTKGTKATEQQVAKKQSAVGKEVDKEEVSAHMFQRLDRDSLVHLLAFLPQGDLHHLHQAYPDLNFAVEAAQNLYWIKDELICYHSKVSFTEDMLGLGITPHHYQNSGDLSDISASLDLLSYASFYTDKVRCGVFHSDTFEDWLPVYISKKHSRNLVMAEKTLARLCRNLHSAAKPRFRPPMVLKVLPALMNTMVVRIMGGEVHESLLALQGYLYFLHLLLAFCQKYPELVKNVDSRVKTFKLNEWGRNKRNCPNLGEFLACLAVSSYSWDDVAMDVLKEVIDRNVKWVIKAFPYLVDITREQPKLALDDESVSILAKYNIIKKKPKDKQDKGKGKDHGKTNGHTTGGASKTGTAPNSVANGTSNGHSIGAEVKSNNGGALAPPKLRRRLSDEEVYNTIDKGRLPKTFKASQVSLRLVMFHVFFLKLLRIKHGKRLTLKETQAALDQSFGRATPSMQARLQREIKFIKTIKDWNMFFTRVGVRPPSKSYLCEWLRNANYNSARRRYHNPEQIRRAQEEAKAAARRAREEEKKRKQGMLLGTVLDDDDLDATLDGDSEAVIAAAERMEYYEDGADRQYRSNRGGRHWW